MLNQKNFREAFAPLHASDQTVKEVLKMTQKNESRSLRWVLRTAMAAALVACLMMTMTVALAGENRPGDTAVEYIPFQAGVFENEEEFLNAIFGLTGYDHVEESLVCDCPDPNNHREMHKYEYTPSSDRVPLVTEMAETLKRYITHVGQSMTWNGYTLTIDSMFYDKVTGFCAVSYVFEGPEGAMDFDITPTGAYSNYYFTPFFGTNLYVAEKSTDMKVVGIGVLCMDEGDIHTIEFNSTVEAGMTLYEMNEVVAGLNYIADAPDGSSEQSRWFASFEDCPHSLEIRVGGPYDLEALTVQSGDVEIVLTPVSIRYKGVDSYDEEELRDHSVVIRFADGTEYVVHNNPKWEYATLYGAEENYLSMGVNMHSEYTRYMFNRLVDLEDVVCVVLDGTEFYVN